ncbi:hypothetical protein HU200_008439 [Digitaria exilis]|uniref:Uncharacterized protein n=1 Tax=Digitaria exilis TaxID=1010633 RepID=A0A835FLJ0_9POAL|nr:hypothetical protein HU200_008439 [Digitaria exilis]
MCATWHEAQGVGDALLLPQETTGAGGTAQQDAAGGKAKQTATAAATVWSTMPAPPPSPVVAMEAVNGNGGGDAADVDRRAAMYISRVQERLRRERTVDWRMYY